jgi:hypothetical protein
MQFKYKALQIRQTQSDRVLAMFAAKATEIDSWTGVPQKKRFGTGEETAGFQREYNQGRVESLRSFYANSDNVIQNPLLCSTRQLPFASAVFTPDANDDAMADLCQGTITIEIPDYEAMPLKDIMGHVRESLERRVPELRDRTPDLAFVSTLKTRATEHGQLQSSPEAEVDGSDKDNGVSDDNDNEDQSSDQEQSSSEASSVLFEESHIVDFWQEVAARHELLKQIDEYDESEFLGFTREAMTSYLRPIVLVEGGHRLRGALAAAYEALNDTSARTLMEDRIARGELPEAVESSMLHEHVRLLPVSLLLTDDPAEQVFQFVVVNQKAVPIGRALLGTIVSTSLSNDELSTVATRLKDAGIPLEESQAITYLSRHPESPFYNLIERGMTGDAKDLLQWNVFSALISIVRDLKGGTLYHGRGDNAQLWRENYLADSKIVSDFEDKGFESPYAYWRSLDGPWRGVFMAFWRAIRNKFGNTDRPESDGFWGKPRSSNLFNKVSLTILVCDFFHFLNDRELTIDAVEDIPGLVETWTSKVKPQYFDRSWDLDRKGIKKDSPGIRKQWSWLWQEYRQSGGDLPAKNLYRQLRPN